MQGFAPFYLYCPPSRYLAKKTSFLNVVCSVTRVRDVSGQKYLAPGPALWKERVCLPKLNKGTKGRFCKAPELSVGCYWEISIDWLGLDSDTGQKTGSRRCGGLGFQSHPSLQLGRERWACGPTNPSMPREGGARWRTGRPANWRPTWEVRAGACAKGGGRVGWQRWTRVGAAGGQVGGGKEGLRTGPVVGRGAPRLDGRIWGLDRSGRTGGGGTGSGAIRRGWDAAGGGEQRGWGDLQLQHLGRYEVMWGPCGETVWSMWEMGGSEVPGGIWVQNIRKRKEFGRHGWDRLGVGGQNLRGFLRRSVEWERNLRSEQSGSWKILIAEEKGISVVESGRDWGVSSQGNQYSVSKSQQRLEGNTWGRAGVGVGGVAQCKMGKCRWGLRLKEGRNLRYRVGVWSWHTGVIDVEIWK